MGHRPYIPFTRRKSLLSPAVGANRRLTAFMLNAVLQLVAVMWMACRHDCCPQAFAGDNYRAVHYLAARRNIGQLGPRRNPLCADLSKSAPLDARVGNRAGTGYVPQ